GFFTLWVGIVGTLGLLGLLLGRAAGPGGTLSATAGAGAGSVSSAVPTGIKASSPLLLPCLVLLAGFWIALRAGLPRLATSGLLASALCGGFVLRDLAMTPQPATMPVAALRVSSLLLSALAVGMVTVAMVLGHWYLVQPKLA